MSKRSVIGVFLYIVRLWGAGAAAVAETLGALVR